MGCVQMALYPAKYNEILVREFYANMTAEAEDPHNPSFGVVYVKGT